MCPFPPPTLSIQLWHSPADLRCPEWPAATGNSFKVFCFPLIITWWKSRNHQEIQLQFMCYWWPGWGFLGLIHLLLPHLEPPLGTHRSWAGPIFSPGSSSATASLARSPQSLWNISLPRCSTFKSSYFTDGPALLEFLYLAIAE